MALAQMTFGHAERGEGLDARPLGPSEHAENRFASPFVCIPMMVATRPLLGALVRQAPSTADEPSDARRRFMELAGGELDRMYRLAGLILGSGPDAEDAGGEALLRGWQSAGSVRSSDDVLAWLDRILVNVCRDRLRRRARVRFIALTAEHDRSGPRDPFVALADRDALIGAMRDLPPDERIVVVLHFWADLTLEAIATRLGWPTGTVKSRLNRALGRIRTALASTDAPR